MAELPSAVLFACTQNSVRSPMAEAIAKHLLGRRVYVDSVGVKPGELNPFAQLVLEEIGIDISHHRAKAFRDLEDDNFDLVVSLSPEAQHQAVEMTRTSACEVEYWPVFDPTVVEGSREAMLDAFRTVRDQLFAKIKRRFEITGGPGV